jgi:hypothetical protein
LTSTTHHCSPWSTLDSGARYGVSEMTGSWSTGSESRRTSNRPGAAREDGEAVRALRAGAVADLGLDALEVRAQRLLLLVVEALGLLLHESPGAIEEGADLGAAGRRRGELPRVEVEEQGEHLRAPHVGLGEPAQAVAGDVVGLHESDTTPAAHRVDAVRAPQRPNREVMPRCQS